MHGTKCRSWLFRVYITLWFTQREETRLLSGVKADTADALTIRVRCHHSVVLASAQSASRSQSRRLGTAIHSAVSRGAVEDSSMECAHYAQQSVTMSKRPTPYSQCDGERAPGDGCLEIQLAGIAHWVMDRRTAAHCGSCFHLVAGGCPVGFAGEAAWWWRERDSYAQRATTQASIPML